MQTIQPAMVLHVQQVASAAGWARRPGPASPLSW